MLITNSKGRQILILADESVEDSVVHSDSRSLATLLLIRDIQVCFTSFFYIIAMHIMCDKLDNLVYSGIFSPNSKVIQHMIKDYA